MEFERFFGYTIAPVISGVFKYKKTGTVLDLGCGYGRHALYLADKGFSVTAVDNDAKKLLELKQNAKRLGLKIETKKADLAHFKTSKKYDIVVAHMALHFLKEKEISEVVSRIKSQTNAGGLNVVGVLTDKHAKGYRPYLFKKNELKKHYADWEVLKYEERMSQSFVRISREKQERQHIAVVIAKKP